MIRMMLAEGPALSSRGPHMSSITPVAGPRKRERLERSSDSPRMSPLTPVTDPRARRLQGERG